MSRSLPKLRAMIANYGGVHVWDRLDTNACMQAVYDIEQLEQQRDLLRTQNNQLVKALDECRFALEPYDDVKPRDWKSDKEKLARAHQTAQAALAAAKGGE